MKESTTKEKVLKNIRDALVNSMPPPYESVDLDSQVFTKPGEEFAEVAFAESFSRANGQFVYCADFVELGQNLKALIKEKNLQSLFCGEEFLSGLLRDLGIQNLNGFNDITQYQAAVTACEVLVSRTGTIVVSSRQECGRKPFSIPAVHIVVASTRQLVYDIKDAFKFLKKKYKDKLPGQISFITGPGRNDDIEKTMVFKSHGPGELYLFLVENR